MYGVSGRTRGVSAWPKVPLARQSYATSPSNHDVAKQLRTLMRTCAQPVTVVSTRLNDTNSSLHGATLSSFSSTALYPFPLVTLSIRRPSRLADALHFNRRANPNAVHGVINILAAHQSQLAIRFSRPDLYPTPFSSVPHRFEDNLPVVEETVGALTFSVLTSLPLSEQVLQTFGATEAEEPIKETDLSSELFIARVMRVLAHADGQNQPRKPLVYYRGDYVSVGPNNHSS